MNYHSVKTVSKWEKELNIALEKTIENDMVVEIRCKVCRECLTPQYKSSNASLIRNGLNE